MFKAFWINVSTRIFENVVDENLSAFRETTPNHGFDGAEEIQNNAKERRNEKEERKRPQNLLLLYWQPLREDPFTNNHVDIKEKKRLGPGPSCSKAD